MKDFWFLWLTSSRFAEVNLKGPVFSVFYIYKRISGLRYKDILWREILVES